MHPGHITQLSKPRERRTSTAWKIIFLKLNFLKKLKVIFKTTLHHTDHFCFLTRSQSPNYLNLDVAACNSQRRIPQKTQEEGYSFSRAVFCSGFNRPYELTEGPVVINRKM